LPHNIPSGLRSWCQTDSYYRYRCLQDIRKSSCWPGRDGIGWIVGIASWIAEINIVDAEDIREEEKAKTIEKCAKIAEQTDAAGRINPGKMVADAIRKLR
jgi:hypothetical protein